MQRSLLVVAIAIVSIAAVLPAWTEKVKKEEEKEKVEMERKAQSDKEILAANAANINALQNQEVRVSVLQQLLNEETAKLRQMEAVFCDQYKLDLEKYRARKYQYDADTGKFIEKTE